MSISLPSEARETWYRDAEKLRKRDRVVLCAATQGVPAAANMSQGAAAADTARRRVPTSVISVQNAQKIAKNYQNQNLELPV